jgi:pimeloyl-ACP methyl ester carboxylesterase
MKFLELHGDRVAYREAGAGEALLLIHGMAGSSATWRAVLPQLSKKYRVVTPDLFGHGESAKPRGDYRWARSRYRCVICSMSSALPGRRWWVSRSVVVWPCNWSISIATIASGWF